MKISVIITAGGVGKRMGADQPKQFIALKGTPILIHTVSRMVSALPTAEFFLTLPVDYMEEGRRLLDQFGFSSISIIEGGVERFDSIKNALVHCQGEIIAVHDGVRPFVSDETISNLIEAAKLHQCAIPYMLINDSMRQLKGEESKIVARKEYVTVQTPQCFDAKILKEAYEQTYSDVFTDDASVVEQLGYTIQLVPGNAENIKITTPFDLKVAELFV